MYRSSEAGDNLQRALGALLGRNLKEDVRRELLRAAVERRTITYGYLMARFHLSRGKELIGVIGEIDRDEARTNAPGFAALVVRKDTGYPGGGFFCWEGLPSELRRPDAEASNARLSDAEKRYVKGLQEEIWCFYGHVAPAQQSLPEEN